MTELMRETFSIEGGDFRSAGRVSGQIKSLVRQLGLPPAVVRRVAIASYEAEMNIVMYARRGEVALTITEEAIRLLFSDQGPGIRDIELAMQEGYSTASEAIREMGFGAGMGLPNIRKNADRFSIESEVGRGTRLDVLVFACPPEGPPA